MSKIEQIEQIVDSYNKSLARAIGGFNQEATKRTAQECFETFKTAIARSATEGFTKEESQRLLELTITLNSKAFLVALDLCNDFNAFSTVLDNLEPSITALENSEIAFRKRGMEFLTQLAFQNMHALPKVAKFSCYKEMRAAMLALSETPNGDNIRTVIAQYANQFIEDDSELKLELPSECRMS